MSEFTCCEELKVCRACGVAKPLAAFYPQRARCTACFLERQRRYQRANPDVMKASRRSWLAENRDRCNDTHAAWKKRNQEKVDGWINQWRATTGLFAYKVLKIRRNASKKGVPCTITGDYIKSLYESQNGRCALTGRELILLPGPLNNPDTMSVDRIDGPLGYVPGNVRLITFQANSARGRGTDDELVAFCKSVLEIHKSKGVSDV